MAAVPPHPRVVALLLVLGVAFGVAAPAVGAEVPAPSGRVLSHVTDARVTAPNSLAISTTYRGLAYLMNQEGPPIVFVVELSTGQVVGTTTLLRTTTKKPLAMAVGDGRLWIADLGDSKGDRFGGTIYSIDEPGRGARQDTPTSYRVTFGGLSSDIHGLLVKPKTNQLYLVSHTDLGEGTFWKLPEPLQPTIDNRIVQNRAEPVAKTATTGATDAVFTPNGKKVLILADQQIRLFDAATWSEEVVVLPNTGTVPNGRGIAVAPNAQAFYVVSEPTDTAATNDSVISTFPLTKELGGTAPGRTTSGGKADGGPEAGRDDGLNSAPAGKPVVKLVHVSPVLVGAGALAVVGGLGWLVLRRLREDRVVKAHQQRYGTGL